MMKEEVILVDENDNAIGTMEKMEAHRQGLLHRAFSIVIFNDAGEMLLQQRAFSKYHSPGLWTNACCSHPRPGETVTDAANRRLFEEMGIHCPLKIIGHFIYSCKFDNGLTEHEYDHVLTGICNENPNINPDEVASYKWISNETLKKEIQTHPDQFTFWFRELLKQQLF